MRIKTAVSERAVSIKKMVAGYICEEPNLSYVRVNVNSCVRKTAGSGNDNSLKGYITKRLTPSDKNVINAELLHKSLVNQPPPPPPPTTALWRPRHLYTKEEKDEQWTDVHGRSSTSRAKVTVKVTLRNSSGIKWSREGENQQTKKGKKSF